MNNDTSRHRGLRRAGGLAALVVMALLTAACGGSPSASRMAGSTTHQSATTSSRTHARHLAGQCIRQHGIPNFPDPIVATSGPAKGKAILDKQALRPVPNSVVTRAMAACQTALAQAGISGHTAGPTISTADQADYLRAADCMRSHGITDFPDPTFSGGHVSFAIPSSIDIHSTQVTQARLICEKLIPSGLPGSGSGG